MKHLILFLFIIMIPSMPLAQVTLSVQTEKGRKEFAENEPILVNVILQTKGKDIVMQTPLRLFSTAQFEVLGQGSEQSSFYDEKSGLMVNQIHYQTLLRAKKTGKYKIGSASVAINDKLYYTEPFDIQITEGGSYAENKTELTLKLSVDKSSPYLHEKVVAVVTAYAKNVDALKKIKNIRLPHHPKIQVLHSDFTKDIVEKNEDLHSQVVGVFVLVPQVVGQVKVPSIQAEVNQSNAQKLVSNSVPLQVKNIPNSQKHKSKIVGHYDLKIIRTDASQSYVGQPSIITVTVSGEGNLDEQKLPTLQKSKYYDFFPPTVNAMRKNDGASFSLEYIVLPKKEGKIKVSTENFTFFDPQAERYQEIKPQSVTLHTLPKENLEPTALNRMMDYSKELLPFDAPSSLPEKKQKNFSRHLSSYLLYGVPLIILVAVSLFFMRRKNSPSIPFEASATSTAQSEFETSESYLNTLFLSITEKQFGSYFSTYQSLHQYIRKRFHAEDDEALFLQVELRCGRNVAEQYKEIHQKIHFEKYAPHQNSDHFYELTQTLKQVLNIVLNETHFE